MCPFLPMISHNVHAFCWLLYYIKIIYNVYITYILKSKVIYFILLFYFLISPWVYDELLNQKVKEKAWIEAEVDKSDHSNKYT